MFHHSHTKKTIFWVVSNNQLSSFKKINESNHTTIIDVSFFFSSHNQLLHASELPLLTGDAIDDIVNLSCHFDNLTANLADVWTDVEIEALFLQKLELCCTPLAFMGLSNIDQACLPAKILTQ